MNSYHVEFSWSLSVLRLCSSLCLLHSICSIHDLFSVCSCSLQQASSFFPPFICNFLLSALRRCNFYTLISFHLIFPFINLIIISPVPFRSIIDSIIFKILRITFVDFFVILNTVYFLCKHLQFYRVIKEPAKTKFPHF